MVQPRFRHALLPSCFESFVEGDLAVGKAAVERKGEKHLWWNALEVESGNIFKAEFPVIFGVADQAAAFGTLVLQASESFPDQGFADALPLVFR